MFLQWEENIYRPFAAGTSSLDDEVSEEESVSESDSESDSDKQSHALLLAP